MGRVSQGVLKKFHVSNIPFEMLTSINYFFDATIQTIGCCLLSIRFLVN